MLDDGSMVQKDQGGEKMSSKSLQSRESSSKCRQTVTTPCDKSFNSRVLPGLEEQQGMSENLLSKVS